MMPVAPVRLLDPWLFLPLLFHPYFLTPQRASALVPVSTVDLFWLRLSHD